MTDYYNSASMEMYLIKGKLIIILNCLLFAYIFIQLINHKVMVSKISLLVELYVTAVSKYIILCQNLNN